MARTTVTVEEGARELARRDRVLARMLRQHGVPELHRRRPRRPHFAELARMICYQQLAGRAAGAIRDLAEKVEQGLVELDRVARLPDDEVVRELVLVRGIGEWTAHMFLMFQL